MSPQDGHSAVRVSRDGDSIAIVTVDRQEAMNSMDAATATAFRDRLLELAGDREVRCVVVTGAGDRAFIGGADIRYMAGVGAAEARHFASLGQEAGRLLETMPKPTIAAVNGYALGGGCELALACDIRYAGSTARLGQPEVNYGLVPGWGGTQRLARTTTIGFAKELIFTGRLVEAEEALARGLVDGVQDPVLDKALETARLLTTKGPAALAASKRLLNLALQGDHEANLAAEERLLADALVGAEAREGLAAFVEKRPPRFGGP